MSISLLHNCCLLMRPNVRNTKTYPRSLYQPHFILPTLDAQWTRCCITLKNVGRKNSKHITFLCDICTKSCVNRLEGLPPLAVTAVLKMWVLCVSVFTNFPTYLENTFSYTYTIGSDSNCIFEWLYLLFNPSVIRQVIVTPYSACGLGQRYLSKTLGRRSEHHFLNTGHDSLNNALHWKCLINLEHFVCWIKYLTNGKGFEKRISMLHK